MRAARWLPDFWERGGEVFGQWLVPLLAVAGVSPRHDRPHNCPYKSAALGLFRLRTAQADPGCAAASAITGPGQVLVAVSAVAAVHRAAPGQAGEMARGDRARILLVRDRFPRGA